VGCRHCRSPHFRSYDRHEVLAAALAAEVVVPPLAVLILTVAFVDAALKLTGSGLNVLSYVGSDSTQTQVHRATAYVSVAGFVAGTVTAIATRNEDAFYEMSKLASDISDLGGLKPTPDTAKSIIITIEKWFDFTEAEKALRGFIDFEQRMDHLSTAGDSSDPAIGPWSENSTSDRTSWAGADLKSPGATYDTSPESNA